MSTRGEDGMVTVWMLGLATITLLLVALVSDGGRVMSAVTATGDTARAAARAGALAIDPTTRTLHPVRADTEARAVVALQQMTPTAVVVDPGGTAVTVTVETTVELPLLALLGVSHRTVSSTATADILEGVTRP